MPRGENVKKGQRPGGRAAGTPNKRTTEALERERIAQQAQAEVDKAKAAKTKLGKDVLEEFMQLFAGMAASHQPWPVLMGKNPSENEGKFLTYAKLTVETARDLAAFQSPKFKAIAVFAPPPNPVPAPTPDGNVVMIDDAVAMARVYQNMIKRVV